MGLAKTLIKVAIGVAIAKGVSGMLQGKAGAAGGGRAGGGADDRLRDVMEGIGQGAGPDRTADRGFGDEALTGNAPRRTNAPRGGLDDLLDSLKGGRGAAEPGTAGGDDLFGAARDAARQGRDSGASGGGGLDDLLGQLTGAAGGARAGQAGAGGTGGGLGDLLGQLTGAAGGQGGGTGGGLGDLLGKLAGAAGGAAAGGAAAGKATGIEDLLGSILGGGAAAGGREAMNEDRQDLAATMILRAMIQAAKCDGRFDAGERQKLMEQTGDLSAAEQALIQAEFQRSFSAEEIAAQTPEGMEAQVYQMSLLAIDLDSRGEAEYLDRLGRALSLSPAALNALHDRAGAARLYR